MKKVISFIGKKQADILKTRIKKLLPGHQFNFKRTDTITAYQQKQEMNSTNLLIITNETITSESDNFINKLKELTNNNPKLQILLFVEEENIALAIKALSAGTFQYVKLPVNDNELKLIIETAIESQPGIIDDQMVAKKDKVKFGEITGNSNQMLKVYDQIEQAAKSDIPILILGETGTGKDLVSYTIHKLSSRSNEAYLAINLGALPSELVASELFGHEKGTFTGALNQHKGVFEQGDKGTVFLDEIDTMDEKVQVSLLRLLEQKKFKRLGGTGSLNSEARLIAATNENIDNLVESGIFRSDLFYRIDVFRIVLPPLRERKSDIPLLVDEMVLKYSKSFKKNITSISREAIDVLMNFDWPGNVRELKNVIQRAVLVCNDEKLKTTHLPPRFHKSKKEKLSVTFEVGTSLAEIEREVITHTLAFTNNNRKEAAKILGISRRAIYNKLERHKI